MDKKQFNVELEGIYNELYKFIYSLIKNKSACDDIVMATVEAAMKKYKTLKNDDKFKSWIFTIGKRLCFDYLRKYGREVATEQIQDFVKDEVANVEEVLINKENISRVKECILELDENNRELLMHRYYNELSFNEISKVMGINVNTAKTWHRRALQSIKNKFDKM